MAFPFANQSDPGCCPDDGSTNAPSTGDSCANPSFVEVCNITDFPVGIEASLAPLGCTLDVNGEQTGKVFIVKVVDEATSVESYTLKFIGVGTSAVVDYDAAIHGDWGACAAVEDQLIYADSCDSRYKIAIDEGAIVSVLEIFDVSGALLDPPITHLPTDADWATFIADVQKCDECLTPSGVCKCYETGVTAGATYENADNTTDISFSHNSTTIKWSVDSPASDGADAFTLAIVACINSGEIANITLSGANGVNTTFAADTVLSSGNGDGTGSYGFSGVAPGSFSDKLTSATLTCGSAVTASEACRFENCQTGEVVWKDVYTDEILTVSQEETLANCVEEDCPEETQQIVSCAAEAITDSNAGAIAIGDEIIFLTKVDCDNFIISSRIFLVANGLEIADGILTEQCDPAPDIETIQSCIKDTQGAEWAQLAILDPSSGAVTATLYYDASLALGTPSGDPLDWENCTSEYIDFRYETLCEVDDAKILLVDSGGSFAQYSFYDQSLSSLSLPTTSSGGGSDIANFLHYAISGTDLLTIDVNTAAIISTTPITGTFGLSAAAFNPSDGFLWSYDYGTDQIYRIDVLTGVATPFGTTIAGIAGSGSSMAIDSTGRVIVAGSAGRIYEVDPIAGTSTLIYTAAEQANGLTFGPNDFLYLGAPSGNLIEINLISAEEQVIADWPPAANSLGYYLVKAATPSCFRRKFGVLPDGSLEYISDHNILDDSERVIQGAVDCCYNCGGSTSETEDTVYQTGFNTEVISGAVTVPSFPTNTKEVVVMNYSEAYLEISTSIGPQTVGPNGTIEFSVDDNEAALSATGITIISGSFGATDNLILNYKTRA